MTDVQCTVSNSQESFVSEPEMIDLGGTIEIGWEPIDLGTLDWWPMPAYSAEATTLPIVQDADGKTWLVQQDENGAWREMLDGDLLGKVVPVRWAVPTDDMIQALAFG
jgi:hypothetical protein